MLHLVAAGRFAIVLGDLYFFDAKAPADQQGAERGIRLELRMLEAEPLVGSEYSAQPIRVDRPIWRVDLLESVAGRPGSFDRTHHHPRFEGWEPGERVFDVELSADPLDWVGRRLSDPAALLERAGVDVSSAPKDDLDDLAAAAPGVVAMLEHLLAEVRTGALAPVPEHQEPVTTRIGWL